MTDSKEWCDGDWRWHSSSKPFAGAESGSPGRALEAGKRGSPGRPVQAGIRGKRLIKLGVRSLANTSRARQFNPLNPPGVGWVNFFIFFKVRVSIRTCMPNLGAVRRERFLTIDNPLNPPGVGWVNFWGWGWVHFFFFKVRLYPHMRAKFGRGAVRRRGPTVKYIIGQKYARTADARTKRVTLNR